MINVWIADAQGARTGTLEDAHRVVREHTGNVWIDFEGEDEGVVREALAPCGVHPLVVEDLVMQVNRPKLDDYTDYVYLVVHSARWENSEDRPALREVDIVVGDHWIVTYHEGETRSVAAARTVLPKRPALLAKSPAHLRVDMIALSFVREPSDLADVHAVMDECGARLPVIAKIEKPEAVDRLGPIVRAFDGLMVARGDLGVEIPLEQVPLVQKRCVRLAREHGKPVIVATQMLDSMIHASHPTRAEASDVANAVMDGADALMLSGETSVGAYPIGAVETMARIIEAAESQGFHNMQSIRRRPETRPEAIALNAVRIAEDLHAVALVAFTETGATARHVAVHRHGIPLLAFTSRPEVRSQLALLWGAETFVVPKMHHTDDMVAMADKALLDLGRGHVGDFVVIVAGTPPGTVGSTNTLRVHKLGGE